ncbi:unnamed protein product [Sphagnum balticum]
MSVWLSDHLGAREVGDLLRWIVSSHPVIVASSYRSWSSAEWEKERPSCLTSPPVDGRGLRGYLPWLSFPAAYKLSYLLVLETGSVELRKALGLPVPDHPVQEIQTVLLVERIPCDAEEINHYWDCQQHQPSGYREVEVRSVQKESTTYGQSQLGEVEATAEGSLEVGADGGIDVAIEIDFYLIDFS